MTTLQWILLGIFAAYALIVNGTAFLLYAADKKKAKEGAWRIKEKTLIGTAFIGGGLGAFLGMKLLRHKTQHKQFLTLVPLGMILGFVVAAALLYVIFFVVR